MKTFFTVLFSISIYVAFGQMTAPAIQWQKSLGGTGMDVARSIQQTSDGGYIVAGYSYSVNGHITTPHGGSDYWVAKLDGTGTIQWQKSLGGSSYDDAYSVQQTNDGGYIVAGRSMSTDGDITGHHGNYNYDYWVVKLDGTGAILWQKSLGGGSYDEAYSIQQTSDGGYVVAGYTETDNNGDVSTNHGYSDYWVLKLNSSGLIQWRRILGGSYVDEAASVQQTSDGGYIVAGYTESTDGDVTGNHGGNPDYWIVKLSNVGSMQWQKSLGGFGSEKVAAIRQTSDGGYIIAGYASSDDGDVTVNHGESDYWIVKLNGTGTIQWQKSLGGSDYDNAYGIQQTNDGGYVVTGSSKSTANDVTGNHGKSDYWVAKLNGIGTLQWQKSLGGVGNDVAFSIQQTSDGGYIVAGSSDSTSGDVTGNHGSADYWIVKLSANPTAVSNTGFTEGFTISPNPTTDIVHLQSQEAIQNVQIMDLSGREVYHSGILNTQNLAIPVAMFAKGLYLLRATTVQGTAMQKFEVR